MLLFVFTRLCTCVRWCAFMSTQHDLLLVYTYYVLILTLINKLTNSGHGVVSFIYAALTQCCSMDEGTLLRIGLRLVVLSYHVVFHS